MQDKTVPSWFLMALGVITLVGIAAITVVQLVPGDHTTAALPPPAPAFSVPGTTTGPQAPVSLIPPTGADQPTATSRSYRMSELPTATQPPPRPSGVTGSYSVLQSFGDSFIGQVELTNTTARELDWTAVLVLPSTVGDLRTSWLESLPQPTLSERGQTYTWTSSVALAAGSTAQLRFHFDRTGSSDNPLSCTVNGSDCRP